jgi:predicted tellurium resistance membrane protein TerC
MADILTIENLGNLLMLCFLQAVLGFDNLLYISIESQRAPVASQKAVRFWGIIIAMALRVVLLFVMIRLIDALAEPFFIMNWDGVLTGGVNFATCVFLLGGIFIMYTAVKGTARPRWFVDESTSMLKPCRWPKMGAARWHVRI